MRNYVVKVWTVITVKALDAETAEAQAFMEMTKDFRGGSLWAAEIMDSWSDCETLEDINRDIARENGYN
jgi:hypothetical protein